MSISFFPIFGNMLNTFFFGYLSLKWRRLTRTLFPIIWLIYLVILEPYYGGDIGDLVFESFKPMVFVPLILYPLLSYVIKPFVVKED